MSSLDVLKDLQDRVTKLEQQLADQPGVDNLQPNVLVVNPDGTVGATLSGGLVIPEATSFAPTQRQAISIVDKSGNTQEQLWGYFNGGALHSLLANANTPTGIRTITDSSDQSSFAQLYDANGVPQSKFLDLNGVAARGVLKLLDAAGASAFLQLADVYFDHTDADQTTSSTGYVDLATVGPSFTVAKAGAYLLMVGCNMYEGGTFSDVWMSAQLGATAASDTWGALGNGSSFSAVRMSKQTLAANTTITAKYRASNGATVAHFRHRWMLALRIG